MLTLPHFTDTEPSCVYLPDRPSRLTYEYIVAMTPDEYEQRMNQGWRKFGRSIFRPVCPTCRECRPIRINIARFALNRSQSRALRRNADLTVRYGPILADETRVNLHNRYQAAQEIHKGWDEAGKTVEEYAAIFCDNPIPSAEISAWRGDQLLAVALTDLTPNTVSGVYHFHDPDQRERSLGTFIMLHCLELALRLNKPYAYFGYYVPACPSLAYKANFRPCEIWDDTAGVWRELG